jgi:peroxiredoxin
MKRREFALAVCSAAASRVAWAQPEAIEWPAVQLLDGRTLAPDSWRGQSAVIVFWETYCPYCKRHNAHIDKLFRSLMNQQTQSLRVLGVALDTDEAAVRRYMASNDFSFPVALDGGVLRRRFTQRRVIPMTCLLDAQGRLVQAIPGEMAEDDVMELASKKR